MGPKELESIARRVRVHAVTMTYKAGSGHPGGSLSEAEILVALYFKHLRIDPRHPSWPDRDRFVLSKGHASPGFYATLAERGFFPARELDGFRRIGRMLQGHADVCVPGVEMSAGSLGQGLSFANGLALSAKLDKKAWRVLVLLGDGEMQEGQVWEAAMTSSHFELDNLTAIVDKNGIQNDWFVKETKGIDPLAEKFRAFGWHPLEVDGHDVGAVLKGLEELDRVRGRPRILICHTVKGKGVSFMENNPDFHGKAPTEAEYRKALAELSVPGGA